MSRIATSIVRSSAGGRSSGRVTRTAENELPGRATGHSVTQKCLPNRSLLRQAMGMSGKSTSVVQARLRPGPGGQGRGERHERRRLLADAVDEVRPGHDRRLHEVEIRGVTSVVLSVEAGKPGLRTVCLELVGD